MKNLIIAFLKRKGFISNSELETIQGDLRKIKSELDSVKHLLTPEKAKEVLDPNLFEFAKKGLKIRVKRVSRSKDIIEVHTSKNCWTDGPASITSHAPFVSISAWYGNYDKNGSRNLSTYNKNYWVSEGSIEMTEFCGVLSKLGFISKIESISSMEMEITKSGAVTWDEVLPKALESIASIFPDIEEKTENPALEKN